VAYCADPWRAPDARRAKKKAGPGARLGGSLDRGAKALWDNSGIRRLGLAVVRAAEALLRPVVRPVWARLPDRAKDRLGHLRR